MITSPTLLEISIPPGVSSLCPLVSPRRFLQGCKDATKSCKVTDLTPLKGSWFGEGWPQNCEKEHSFRTFYIQLLKNKSF